MDLPRLKQFLMSWQGSVTAISALLAAATSLSKDITGLAPTPQDAAGILAYIRWIVPATFLIVAAASLWSAISRRSKLLRAERFFVRVDRPNQLIGREDELRELLNVCSRRSLVFLLGESGSGKSALVRAGLIPNLRAKSNERYHQSLPILIDGSQLNWQGGRSGLAALISSNLKELNDQERSSLGATDVPTADNVFDWLDKLPIDSARQLLIVIDQFDDYATRWKQRLLREGLVLTCDELCATHDDWCALAKQVRLDRLRLLIVCRSDTSWALETVRFVEPSQCPPLPRINVNLLSGVLDQLTVDDGKGPVVSEPEFGWDRLKVRLLRDLSIGGGDVLPVQLTVAIESLRFLKSLTIREYERQGGLAGLERAYFQKRVNDAARLIGTQCETLVNSLQCLVIDAGRKTTWVTEANLAASLAPGGVNASLFSNAIELLENEHIVRRCMGPTGAEVALYHDFLARGARQTWLQYNRWNELLRQHAQLWRDASSFRDHWNALLTVREQCVLIGARIHGHFRYGPDQFIAWLSVLRTLPLAMSVVLGVGLPPLLFISHNQQRAIHEREGRQNAYQAIEEAIFPADSA